MERTDQMTAPTLTRSGGESHFPIRFDGTELLPSGQTLRIHDPRETAPPCFLVGSVRSGTTLLRLMLDHHPELAFFSEFEFAVDFLEVEGAWPDLKDYQDYLGGHRIFQDSRFEVDPRLSYPDLVRSFLRQKRDRDGKVRVGATVHHDFAKVLRIWPDAIFIHILRDPRDVGRSRIDMGWSGNMHLGVGTWIEAEDAWDELCKVVPPDRRAEIRYEDLVRRPEANLRRLCDFLGLEFDRAMLMYPADSTYSPPDLSLIDQWRRKLSAEAVQLAEATIGDRLVGRGYEPSGLPTVEITPGKKRWLKVQDRLYRLGFRKRRFGIGLLLAQMLMNRVDPVVKRVLDWECQIRSRLFEIERLHLK